MPATEYTRADIEEAWNDPEFHTLPEDKRIGIIAEMDPQFRALKAIDRRRIAQRFYHQVIGPKPAGKSPTEAMDAVEAMSQVPQLAPPQYGTIAGPPMPPQPPIARNPMARQAPPAAPPPEMRGDRVMMPPPAPPQPETPPMPPVKPPGAPRTVARTGPYTTVLGQAEEAEFQKWVAGNQIPFDQGP